MSRSTGARRLTNRVPSMPQYVVEDESANFKLTVDLGDCEERLPPLAVILGFLGCPSRVARSLARSFNSATGYDTAWVVPPPVVTFSPTTGPKKAFASALANALSAPTEAGGTLGFGGIVLVSFSNSGAYVVQTLHELITASDASPAWTDLYKRIAGVVFDSGPCSVSSPLLGAQAQLAGNKSFDLSSSALALARSSCFMLSNFLRTGEPGGKCTKADVESRH